MPAHPKKNISYVPLGEVFSAKLLALLLRSVNEILDRTGGVTGTALPLRNYTVATLPDATAYPYNMVFVTDEAGGATPAFSDGSQWRRTSDRAVVS